MYVYTCMFVSMHASALRSQKRLSDPLELDLEVIVSCLLWVLGPSVWETFQIQVITVTVDPHLYDRTGLMFRVVMGKPSRRNI